MTKGPTTVELVGRRPSKPLKEPLLDDDLPPVPSSSRPQSPRNNQIFLKDDGGRQRIITPGKPEDFGCDNTVKTSKYTLWTFFPISLREQFRRLGNIYFLLTGLLMALGWYTDVFDSAFSPSSTLGPLAIVIGISLMQEGATDFRRHQSDEETNNHECTILDKVAPDDGKAADVLGGKDIVVDVPDGNAVVAYRNVRRADIVAGNFVLIRNREMVPADVVLVASSGDSGSAFIETSSIDGETNLKLRLSPNWKAAGEGHKPSRTESLEEASKRLVSCSVLGYPRGVMASRNPLNRPSLDGDELELQREDFYAETTEAATDAPSRRTLLQKIGSSFRKRQPAVDVTPTNSYDGDHGNGYVMVLDSELPNAHVNNYSGCLTLPPLQPETPSPTLPLGADNLLLRGAVLRNTEWAIGIVVFTGTDTKLVQNTVATPSKFSQLDQLVNRTIRLLMIVMVVVCCILSGLATYSHYGTLGELWYVGYDDGGGSYWPYLPDLEAPEWIFDPPAFWQSFLSFSTLLSNFVPLSLYVTIEIATYFMMFLIASDVSMYHEETNTPAMARSTIVTDLGQVQYVFSDKTGTLTQNVMTFKRCSVDGIAFGAPVEKKTADLNKSDDDVANGGDDDKTNVTSFLPLKQLLTSRVKTPDVGSTSADNTSTTPSQKLTFNAEMFLRVMSICHTVVVEKDYDASTEIVKGDSKKNKSLLKKLQKKMDKIQKYTESMVSSSPKTTTTTTSVTFSGDTAQKPSGGATAEIKQAYTSDTTQSNISVDDPPKGKDGAPMGFAYQAESPDEGALVSAAAQEYDFQVVARDSNGVYLKCSSPSILENKEIVEGLRTGVISPKRLAAESAYPDNNDDDAEGDDDDAATVAKEEIWSILAVNKFDSTRKRMSILVRSPPHLGSLPILFCKGADSAMLDETVCTARTLGDNPESSSQSLLSSTDIDGDKQNEWELSTMLELQSHLGDFASEGLRTLVLGVRFLTERECESWLAQYNAASTSLSDRDGLLTAAAMDIERQLHIVGATAIEDKLQDGVPETIAKLARAGIKLWVLTGDKRETAIEIGYSTKVLTPQMHLKELTGGEKERVRASLAMEFIKLVKVGKLGMYQRAALENADEREETWMVRWGRCLDGAVWRKNDVEDEINPLQRRKKVRDYADYIIQVFLRSETRTRPDADETSEAGIELMLSDDSLDSLPLVFQRAASARKMSSMRANLGLISPSSARKIAMFSNLSCEDVVTEEYILSMESFVAERDGSEEFNKTKRTLLERIFAVDSDVRHGRLRKHAKDDLVPPSPPPIHESGSVDEGDRQKTSDGNASRALVIEGAALIHILGDPLLEEMLFAVANGCDSVIACRVSPKQKALLVRLVRNYVSPTPITLAIGDGANDVGMIQEAHVGIGISGLEGQQAVNASDFSIAQFRFLQELLLVHGRWNFIRMSVHVLFSFYKNAVMACFLAAFSPLTRYSGTALFDMWVTTMYNFVAAMPIIFYSLFDRDLEKDYVLKHPEVYSSTRNNEYIKYRTMLRWVVLCFAHVLIIWGLCSPVLTGGAGNTSSVFGGWMGNNGDDDWMGNGEAGDLKSVGTVIYTVLIISLIFKVLYESKTIIHGEFPPFTCNKDKGEGWLNRLPYTWLGITIFSFIFWLCSAYMYSLVGRIAQSEDLTGFTDVAMHVFHMHPLTWLVCILVPITAAIFDVTGKLFSNMYYPTQTQIHMEIAQQEKEKAKRIMMGQEDNTREIV